jgi:hypothetical protein
MAARMLRQAGQGCPSNSNARTRGARFLAADPSPI